MILAYIKHRTQRAFCTGVCAHNSDDALFSLSRRLIKHISLRRKEMRHAYNARVTSHAFEKPSKRSRFAVMWIKRLLFARHDVSVLITPRERISLANCRSLRRARIKRIIVGRYGGSYIAAARSSGGDNSSDSSNSTALSEWLINVRGSVCLRSQFSLLSISSSRWTFDNFYLVPSGYIVIRAAETIRSKLERGVTDHLWNFCHAVVCWGRFRSIAQRSRTN